MSFVPPPRPPTPDTGLRPAAQEEHRDTTGHTACCAAHLRACVDSNPYRHPKYPVSPSRILSKRRVVHQIQAHDPSWRLDPHQPEITVTPWFCNFTVSRRVITSVPSNVHVPAIPFAFSMPCAFLPVGRSQAAPQTRM